MKKKYSLLLFLVLLHVALWAIKKPPQPSSDDLVYVENAKSLLAGDYHLNESPKNHRLVVFAPVALLIAVFGESPWVISSWPLLCSIITLVVMFSMIDRHSGLTHAFASGLLLATNTLQVDYSDSLFPDVIVAFFAFSFVLLIFKARFQAGHHWIFVVATVLAFYTGYLAKEIIIFVLPFAVVAMAMDIKARIQTAFWKKLSAAMVIVGIIFAGVYYLMSGQVTFLYDTVQTRHSFEYSLHSFNEIVRRLTYEPALMIGNNVGYVILFLAALHFFITGVYKKAKGANKMIRFFLLYLVVLLLTYWFVPISLSQPSFIHLDPRMWMMLLAPLYIIGGYTVAKMVEEVNMKGIQFYAMIFLIVGIAAHIFISHQRALMFDMFALSAAIILLMNKKAIILNKLWLVLIVLTPAIILALRFTTANSNY